MPLLLAFSYTQTIGTAHCYLFEIGRLSSSCIPTKIFGDHLNLCELTFRFVNSTIRTIVEDLHS